MKTTRTVLNSNICIQFLSLFIAVFTLFSANASEIIERNFTSGGHHFHADELSVIPYTFKTIQDDKLLLITHNSDYWDNQHITWNATEKLVRFFQTNQYPLLYLADIQDRSVMNQFDFSKSSFLPGSLQKSDMYAYQGDSHRIIMKGAHIAIAGGNFTICACNTVRSAIALSESSSTLNIHYAMDAIYEGLKDKQVTLAEISSQLVDSAFLQYLKNSYLNADSLPCADPTLIAMDRKFKYHVYRHGQYLGDLADGTTEVNLFFGDTNETLRSLSSP